MVTAVVNDLEDSTVKLTCKESTSCDNCTGPGCKTGDKEVQLTATNPYQFQLNPGDLVEVEPATGIFWPLTGLLFVSPLLLFILGTAGGAFLAPLIAPGLAAELVGFLTGIAVLLLSVPVIRLGLKRVNQSLPLLSVTRVINSVEADSNQTQP